MGNLHPRWEKAGQNRAVDHKENLYVPGIFDGRIPKYNGLFGTDMIADEVWGQADFTENGPNRGKATPDSNTRNSAHMVTFDCAGNMWVADRETSAYSVFPGPPKKNYR